MREGSVLYKMLQDHSNVSFVYKYGKYYQVDKTGRWLNLQYSFIFHERQVVNNEVRENIHFQLFSEDENNLPVPESEVILDINECRFPNLIHSENAMQYRNDKLLRISKRLMPDLQ